MNKPHQRIGSKSNAQVGRDFEVAAIAFFKGTGLDLVRDVNIPVGIETNKKHHSFDLGCSTKKIIIECKSHKWTTGNNVPSAKLAVWNEAMYYFVSSPIGYRKIMFVLRDYSEKHGQTLAEYYLTTYNHLVPSDVEFWEYCDKDKNAIQLV